MSHEISIQKTENSRISELDFNNIPFGKKFSDHMFVADYYEKDWHDCRILPFSNLSMHPATSALHYGQAVFEGMKAYKSPSGDALLFRPVDNLRRLNRSAKRMAMAQVPEKLFMNALTELVAIDKEWIPTVNGSALYIRPVMIATEEYVGIKPADHFKLFIIMCPVGPYYEQPVKVFIDDQHTRAFPGGTGTAKAAGNYAATLYPLELAKEKGYDQILWLDGKEFKYFQEIGTMNVFFVIEDKVITPTLDEGTILDGITRDSVIKLLKQKGIIVEERRITVDEIFQAYEHKLLKEIFGTGTAATISQISDMGYKGKNYKLPTQSESISTTVKKELEEIKRALIPDPFNWVYKVEAEVVV